MGKEQELLEAARNGNLALVERILNLRIKKSGPLASLRRGPGPNTQDASGYTCLHHSSLNGHKEVVGLLLAHDANPNIVDNKGSTAFHLASWTGNYDIVHMLLTQSSSVPNVNLKNNDQETALHSAAQYGHSSVVSLLLQHGADPAFRNNKEESPLDLAAQYGRLEAVDLLLRTRPNLVKDLIKKHSPLHLASRNGHRHVVKLLLNAKFDVNYLTETGTALHEAALYGKIEVVKLLLDYGVDVELEDNKKRTVLDLLNDVNTSIAKQTKRLINEHTTLVSTEEEPDTLTVISDNSSHCISPPPGYTDSTPEHQIYSNVLVPDKSFNSFDRNETPTNVFTSPANSEFSFYEVPPPPRLSNSKRSSGASDELKGSKNVFSRSQDSILDGYSTSSSRSPSFLDYETGPPLPPRERLGSNKVSRSTDSADQLYEVIPVLPSSVNGDYGYGSIQRRDVVRRSVGFNENEIILRPDSQASTGTWSNHSSNYIPITGKPAPPAKPPRKSISPLNRALSQQQYYSKSQHQLHIQPNRASGCEYMTIGPGDSHTLDNSMKRSASNDGDGYVDMRNYPPHFSTFLGSSSAHPAQSLDNHRLMSESAFSILYDEIANGSNSNNSTSQIPPSASISSMRETAEGTTLSLCRNHNNKHLKSNLHHMRSKSEHHPRCPNYEAPCFLKLHQEETGDDNRAKRATVQLPVEIDKSPPSSMAAEDGIQSVIRPLSQNEKNGGNFACTCNRNFKIAGEQESITQEIVPNQHVADSGRSFTPHLPVDPTPEFEPKAHFVSDFHFDQEEVSEYKRRSKRRSKDIETSTECAYISAYNSDGSSVQVTLRKPQLRIKLENKLTETDNSSENFDENPFAGLYRGSIKSCLSQKTQHCSYVVNGKKSLKKQKQSINESGNTIERRKRRIKTLSKDNKSSNSKPSSMSTEQEIRVQEVEPETEVKEPEISCLSMSPFDENAEWAEIANIVASFGSNIGISNNTNLSEEHDGAQTLNQKKSGDENFGLMVEKWLSELGLDEHANTLLNNGYDNLDFMGSNVMEDTDLLEIGIKDGLERGRILEAAEKLPKVKQLEANVKYTVEEWLKSLKLTEYSKVFHENGFTDMERVKKIWEVELNAVLEINKLGHRKRILASVGERLSLITDLGLDDLDFDKLNLNIDELNNDTSHLFVENGSRPTSANDKSQGSDSRPSSATSSVKYNHASCKTPEKSVPNHPACQLNQICNPEWKHDPKDLVKNSFKFTAYYLGSTQVKEVLGDRSTRESIKKFKGSTKDIMKIPSVILSISFTGVKFINAQTNQTVCEHEIKNIHCACQDADDFKHFAYITKELETSNHYCHVFCAQNLDMASEIILTLGQSFEVAYQLALGEDIEELSKAYKEMHAPRKPIPSPPPRTTSYSITTPITPVTTVIYGSKSEDEFQNDKELEKCNTKKDLLNDSATFQKDELTPTVIIITNEPQIVKTSYPPQSSEITFSTTPGPIIGALNNGPKIKPPTAAKPKTKNKPIPPAKPASLKPSGSPANTLTRKFKT